MNKQECLSKMIAPGTRRPGKWRDGVIQILVTSSCDLGCFHCTQASNLRRAKWFMSPDHFEKACQSLEGYFGVVGVFGGNPALSPHFESYCDILEKYFPKEQRGLWCNNPLGKGKLMRRTFNPGHSNLNVHLSQKAYMEFKRDWPECHPVGLTEDSRHSPVIGSMNDLQIPQEVQWDLISQCDINQHWSALLGVFRGELRAWFCEVAASQAILMQDVENYPDSGMQAAPGWWRKPMADFEDQVDQHCTNCLVPLRGYGQLAQNKHPKAKEQTTEMFKEKYKPKKLERPVHVVSDVKDLRPQALGKVVDYIQNAKR